MKKAYNLSIHHVGGRQGTMEFPFCSKAIEKNIVRVLYDADESCLDDIEDKLSSLVNTNVLPYCISDKTTSDKFYLVADRYESSLIKPTKISQIYIENSQFSWDFDMKNHIDETIDIDAVSLDNLFIKNKNNKISLPDFLSLDVEGAERKILKGAKRILKDKILSVKCEFHSFKDCAKLIKVLSKYGFVISNTLLFNSGFQSVEQINLGLTSSFEATNQSGDITFIKTEQYILKNHKSPELDLLKLAFISFINKKLDSMYKYLYSFNKIKNSNKKLKKYAKKAVYIAFLNDFIKEMNKYPIIKKVKFSHLFPTSLSRSNRFSDNKLNKLDIRNNYFKSNDREEFKTNFLYLVSNNYIGIEIVCNKYNFEEYANSFKAKRLSDVPKLLSRLDLLEDIGNGKARISQQELNKL